MDRTHLERAAVSYGQLRGLLLVPVGVLFGLAALANWNVLPDWALATGVALVGLVCVRINQHYREHYGHVRQTARQRRRDALGAGLRTHHLVIFGALLLAGALPVWEGEDSANAGLLLGGVALALTGAFDHRAFLRTFGRPAGA